ncbi:MAG TPA: hypothetical protein VGO62_02460, partial [Myxococcota bacterium]
LVDVGSRDAPTVKARPDAATAVEATELGDARGEDEPRAQHFVNERGSVVVEPLGHGVVRVLLRGIADQAAFDFVRSAVDREHARAPRGAKVLLYFDTTGMTAFERGFRRSMVRWHAEAKQSMEQVVLVRSRIVALAVRSADRLIGGGATATADRARFERMLNEEVRRRAGMPR